MLAVLAAVAVADGDAAAQRPVAVSGQVREVVVLENTKTTDDTVVFIANLDVGDDWDAGEKETTKIRLVSSGLFKEVEVVDEIHPKGGVKVTIIARDKHSWIVAPTYYDQPTNRGFGVGFGENNLFGENKKLLLYGQVATGDSFFIGAYIDPSIGGTPFNLQVDTLLKKERVIEYAVPTSLRDESIAVRQSKLNYLNGGLKLGLTILRRLDLSARIRGAKVSYDDDVELPEGATPEDLGDGFPADATSLPKPGAAGWDVSTELVVKWDRRANFYGVSEGSKLQLSYESGQPVLGSDFDYWYATFSFERARRFWSSGNFIIRGMIGWGEDLPFQQEYTSGGTSLRGYKNRQFRGDFKTAGNVELSTQFFNVKGFAMRALTFLDTSYTTFHDADEEDRFRNYLPNAGRRGLAPFKNSVGVGTRLYIRQIVLPLLGLDLGYGLESGGVEIYLAIGLTDG